MSTLSWTNEETGATSYLLFDAVTFSEYAREGIVTEYNIESGAAIADHYRPGTRSLTLELFVSDTPIRIPQAPEGLEGTEIAALPSGSKRSVELEAIEPFNQPNPVIGLPSQRLVRANLDRARQNRPKRATLLKFDGLVTRRVDVFSALDDLITNRQFLTITLLETEIPNVLITNLRVPQDPSTGTGLLFYVDLVQVDTIETTTSFEKAAEPKHKKKKRKGRQEVTPPTQEQDAQVAEVFQRENVPESANWENTLARSDAYKILGGL